jgi:hypothetical protein
VRLIQTAPEGAAVQGAAQTNAGAVPRQALAGDAGWLAPTDAALPGAGTPLPASPGPSTVEGTVAQWLITAHDMLLDPQYNDAGVGVVAGTPGQGQDQVYWTETLGGASASAAV